MSALKSLFGPSREEIWRQLAREVDGQVLDGSIFRPLAVQVRTDDWIITLDTLSDPNSGATYTRLRAPYFNPERFRFQIYRATFFSDLGKAFGMQDIEVGHPRFDRDFVIKGNEPGRVQRLFDNERIRRLIDAQPRIHVTVKAHEGMLSKFPAGMDELHFQASGTIKDLDRLRQLFDLFAEVLQQICHEGKAYEDDIRIHMWRLRAPGGQIRDRHLLWEGNEPRRDAAAALGRLGDPRPAPRSPPCSGTRTPCSSHGRSKHSPESGTRGRSAPSSAGSATPRRPTTDGPSANTGPTRCGSWAKGHWSTP